MDLSSFCLTIENNLDNTICDQVIDFYNNNTHLHQRFDLNGNPNFTQLNLTQNASLNPMLHKQVCDAALKAIDIYRSKVTESRNWPSKFTFEQIRIKHYFPDGIDQFADHVDVTSANDCKRFLAFFWYLNDVEEGGETEFLNFSLTNKPKKGTLFMFPPLWMFPHRGNPPISNEKYLLSSYLHYVPI